MKRSSGCVLSANVFITFSGRSNIQSILNCVMAAAQVPIAQPTSSGRGSSPAVKEEDVIIILHQQQTMHVAHNIPNTIHTFSEGTQKGSLCTYTALCSITWCMNPQLEEITCTYLYWTRTDSHTGTYSTKRSVCVDSQRKWWGDRVHCHITHTDVYNEWVWWETVLQWLTVKMECRTGCILGECYRHVRQERITTVKCQVLQLLVVG